MLNGKKDIFDEEFAAAVTGFQEKYRGEILTPNNLKYGTGFVGSATRAKLNILYGCGKKIDLPIVATTTTQVSVTSRVVETTKDGTKVDYVFAPTSVAKWIVTIVCQSSISASAKGGGGCGDKTELVFTETNQYLYPWPIWFKNSSNENQTAGIKAVAYDAKDNYLGGDSDAVTVPPIPIPSSQPSITVSNPKGGETFSNNSPTITLSWMSNYAVKVPYAYLVSSESADGRSVVPGRILNQNSSGSTENWLINAVLTPGQYHIKICDQGSNIITPICGFSNYFTISLATSTQSSITVLSPNGGESWAIGSTQTIRWNSSNVGKVSIWLCKAGTCGRFGTIPATGITNTGSYSFVVSTSTNPFGAYTPGSDLKIRVASEDNYPTSTLYDDSNSTFTITLPPLTDQEIITGLANVVRRNQCSPLTIANCDPNFDFNGDVLVNVTDVAIMTGILSRSDSVFDTVYKKTKAAVYARLGSKIGAANFIPEFDVDKNNVINQNDWERISKALIGTRVYPPPNINPSITSIAPLQITAGTTTAVALYGKILIQHSQWRLPDRAPV